MVPPSLLDITMKAVFDNIDYFDKNLVKTIIEPVRPRMLDQILQMAKIHRHEVCDGQENHVDKIWAVLPFLINSKFYTKLDFGQNLLSLASMHCNSFTLTDSRLHEFIRSLASNTPNLREFKICYLNTNSLGERELDSIIQLKNLCILQLDDVFVPFSGMLDISRRCEKLKSIQANQVIFEEVPSNLTLRHDFVFVFIQGPTDCNPDQLFLWMATTKQTCWNPNQADDTKYIELSLTEPEKIKYFSLAQGLAKNLTDIHIISTDSKDIDEMDEFPYLPHLKTAFFHCRSKSAHVLRCLMKRNGKTLQELSLKDINMEKKMTFGEIFGFCPNLQSLYLYDCTVCANNAPVDAMRQLKKFEWTNEYYYRLTYLEQREYPEIAFSSILSAPLLEVLNIQLPNIDFSDNATVISRIERREILRNLKKSNMVESMGFISEIYPENLSLYRDSFNELKNAIDSLISAHPN